MKIIFKPFFLLFVIIIIGSFLRLYQLGKVPASLNWDEVSLGYNAYSILKTGNDEYGKTLPVVLRSYDDYKPALYVYFDIPFVATLGLTEQAVRLPSALAGIASIILVYFLVLEILGKKSITLIKKEIPGSTVALLAAFFLAISPWHIQFSRIAFESNVGLALNILAFFLFLKGMKKPYFLVIAFFVAALNIHMYQSERVFSPLLILVLSIIFFKKIIKKKIWIIGSILVAILVALPLLVFIMGNENALLRAKGVSVFSEQSLVKRSAAKLLDDTVNGNTLGKILDNRRVEFGKAVVSGYISHFDMNWLFITGDLARHHAPFMGLLYLFELPFLFIGLYFFTFLNIDIKHKIAFFAYFLLVPIPASITSGVPHAVRTLNFEWTWEVFIAIGVLATVLFVISQKNKLRRLSFSLLLFVYCLFSLLNIAYYLNQYFVQLNYFNSSEWLFGYKEAIAYSDSIRSKYDKVVVENEVPFDQSYMFFLFYLKVDPKYYQSLGGTSSGGFKEEHRGFYNYTFQHLPTERESGRVLRVGRAGDIPEKSSNRYVIKNPDGTPAVAIGEK